jgi:small multidrug resistance pump
MIYYMCLFAAILIGVAGQMALKTGSLNAAHTSQFILFEPYIIGGLFCYFASAIFYIYALKKIPVSVAFPSVSFSYIIVSLLAHFIWHEPLHLQHGIALLLIFLGVVLLMNA